MILATCFQGEYETRSPNTLYSTATIAFAEQLAINWTFQQISIAKHNNSKFICTAEW